MLDDGQIAWNLSWEIKDVTYSKFVVWRRETIKKCGKYDFEAGKKIISLE